MHVTNTKEQAAKIAIEEGLEWGLSVFDGKYYVGTALQLIALGCICQ